MRSGPRTLFFNVFGPKSLQCEAFGSRGCPGLKRKRVHRFLLQKCLQAKGLGGSVPDLYLEHWEDAKK